MVVVFERILSLPMRTAPLCLATAALMRLSALAGRPPGTNAQSEAALAVFILAGQSNADGHNNTATCNLGGQAFPDALRQQPSIMFWPGSNARAALQNTWTTLQVGASAVGDAAFGPEITFGHDMAAAMPGTRIAIIKYAVGGTGIARSKEYSDYIPQLAGFNDNGNNWHPPEPGQPAGALYANLLTNVQGALQSLGARGQPYHLAGVLWMQGEHEAGISLRMANDYEKLLGDFVRHLRADLGQPTLPVVIGQVSDKWLYREPVQAAQSRVSHNAPPAALVLTRDLPRTPGDDAHYDANGMATLGSRFATAMQSLLAEAGSGSGQASNPAPALVKPTPEQAAWQDLELGMFYHFDITVFTDGRRGRLADARATSTPVSTTPPSSAPISGWRRPRRWAPATRCSWPSTARGSCRGRATPIRTACDSRSGAMARATWSTTTSPRAGSRASSPASIAACRPTPTAHVFESASSRDANDPIDPRQVRVPRRARQDW